MNTDEISGVIDAVAAAPFRPDGWTDALRAMARISGGWGGQLIVQAKERLEFNSVVTLPREAFDDYVKHGSNDISRTPRLRAVLGGPLMRTLCDDDYITNARSWIPSTSCCRICVEPSKFGLRLRLRLLN